MTGNRETAFISAVASAGIVHAITKGCSAGNLTECGCDSQPGGQRYTDLVHFLFFLKILKFRIF